MQRVFQRSATLFRHFYTSSSTMGKSKGSSTKLPNEQKVEASSAIQQDKSDRIIIRIHGTPNASCSAIKGMNEEEIDVAIGAQARENEANKELLEFMAQILQLKKTEIDFLRGAKSRSKMLVISAPRLSVDEVRRRIAEQINP